MRPLRACQETALELNDLCVLVVALSPSHLLLMLLLQVKLMKDVLDEWRREVDKKPPEMSVEEALEILGLPTGQGG